MRASGPWHTRGHACRIDGHHAHGCLSRGTADLAGRTLVINLLGSSKAACEDTRVVLGAIGCGLRMLRGDPVDCAVRSGRDGQPCV